MENPEIAIRQAELILHLFELRREAVMRAARGYIGGEFMPRTADEFVGLVTAGDQHTSYILQVYGYWDMVAAFVLSGALTEPLVYRTCQEMYFQYAKIQPHLAEFRRQMNLPEFMQNIQTVVEGSEAGRKRLTDMRNNLEAIAKARAAEPIGPATPQEPNRKTAARRARPQQRRKRAIAKKEEPHG
jgi:hypothetical protein